MGSVSYSDDFSDGLDDGGGSNSAASNEPPRFAEKETKTVRWVKVLAFAVLTLLTVAASVLLYQYVTNAERTEFETTFHNDTVKILASLGAGFERTLMAADAFAVSVVSHANATDQQWPYVTVPDFAIRAGKVRDSAGALRQ